MFQAETPVGAAGGIETRTGRPLSPRERIVLQHIARGLVTPEIADDLGVSPETVRSQVHNAMMKLNARTRAHAVAIAAAQGQLALVSEGSDLVTA